MILITVDIKSTRKLANFPINPHCANFCMEFFSFWIDKNRLDMRIVDKILTILYVKNARSKTAEKIA